MKAQLGIEFDSFIQSLSTPAPVSLRLNLAKRVVRGVDKVPWCSTGRYLAERPVFTLDPVFHAGAYYVQEASSMFLEQFIIRQKLNDAPITVLDLCAAPGGKSTHLLSLLHPESLLVCNEVVKSRTRILQENLTKWGSANFCITQNDPSDFSKLPGFFDLILVDAPCSGEGLFRKDPNAMTEWSMENTALCALRQQRILKDVWPALKENGVLIYSTCTYNPEENERNIRWLLDGFRGEPLQLKIPSEWSINELSVGDGVAYQFSPHRNKGEGFFIGAIRKKEPVANSIKLPKKQKGGSRIHSEVKDWLINPDYFTIDENGDGLYFIPRTHYTNLLTVQENLRVVQQGTSLAVVKGNKLIPGHGLALSIHLDRSKFETRELSREEALRYLRRDTTGNLSASPGYVLITHENVPLGWVHMLPGRYNNLYPKEWRIRMTP